MEADTLGIAREVVLEEASALNLRIEISRWVYFLFAVPTIVAGYMTLQFVLKLFPGDDCGKWSWVRQFTDFSHWSGAPSIYCLGDLTEGTPWIYAPIQTYFYVACVAACGYLTYVANGDGVGAVPRRQATGPWRELGGRRLAC
jgi:hypothetical protein